MVQEYRLHTCQSSVCPQKISDLSLFEHSLHTIHPLLCRATVSDAEHEGSLCPICGNSEH
jgi:hypothetical protein